MATNEYRSLAGTLFTKFRIGLTGLYLSVVSGKIRARNAADSADAPLVGSVIAASGDALELNEDATSAGADWKLTLQRSTTGMAEARTYIFPTALPTAGDALTVASVAAGVVQFNHSQIASGADKGVTDTTSIAFNQGSPTTMFTLPANAVVQEVKVVIDTAFTGAPTLSVGISGTTAKYLGSTDNDLTQAAGTSFSVSPNVVPVGSTEVIIATYAAGGAGAGAARLLVTYVVPS